ncbi:MAG: DNA recombination protein RmuC [Pedobacter sp.]|nr:MAG: DNA recombination protein RmuC [Pedobacter sp.]
MTLESLIIIGIAFLVILAISYFLNQKIQHYQRLWQAEQSKAIKLETELSYERKAQLELKQLSQSMQEQLQLSFSQVAQQLFEDKAAKLNTQNQIQLDQILNPLKENIKNFEAKVNQVYKDESAERNQLKGVISQLMEQSRQIHQDANNLTKALKGDVKQQGNWGEVILERLLNQAGLEKGREYRTQVSILSADGAKYMPDVIIDLPDDKHLIVDAKISLLAYERMINAADELEKKIHLKDHLSAIKSHIDKLALKNYQHLSNVNSPDFVLLFMPIESSFSITMQADTELFHYAWDKKIVIVSPTTLLATLKTIASIWKIDRQNKNVYEIAQEAGSLYDKFVGFLEDMNKIGKYLDQSKKAHEDAFKKLQTGAGNLIGKVEKIKKLGAKTKLNKQIDSKFLIPEDDLENTDNPD